MFDKCIDPRTFIRSDVKCAERLNPSKEPNAESFDFLATLGVTWYGYVLHSDDLKKNLWAVYGTCGDIDIVRVGESFVICSPFESMRKSGMKIAQIGCDRDASFWHLNIRHLRKSGFPVIDQPQRLWRKVDGFTQIKCKAEAESLWYLGDRRFEVVLVNMRIEAMCDDAYTYEGADQMISTSYLDVAIGACCRMLEGACAGTAACKPEQE